MAYVGFLHYSPYNEIFTERMTMSLQRLDEGFEKWMLAKIMLRFEASGTTYLLLWCTIKFPLRIRGLLDRGLIMREASHVLSTNT